MSKKTKLLIAILFATCGYIQSSSGGEIVSSTETVDSLNASIDQLKKRHEAEIEKLKGQIDELNGRHTRELSEVRSEFNKNYDALVESMPRVFSEQKITAEILSEHTTSVNNLISRSSKYSLDEIKSALNNCGAKGLTFDGNDNLDGVARVVGAVCEDLKKKHGGAHAQRNAMIVAVGVFGGVSVCCLIKAVRDALSNQ